MPPPLGTWSAPSRKRWRRGCGRRISAAARAPATWRPRPPSAAPRTRSMTRTRHLTLVTLLLTMTRAADSQQPPRPTTLAHRSTVYAPRGMIATSQPLATAAGLAVLERGGNAVDAAVTAAAVLNVVEPPMTGIGGDMFAIVWSAKEHKLVGINASGRSGSLMTRQELLRRGRTRMPEESVEDITVPGALSGWAALLE